MIDEISFDNEKVREVFGRERTNKLDNLISINIFGLDLDENDTIGEEYVEIRDGILTSYCDDLRKDMSVSDRDIEVMKVMIDRKFLQFDALTAPFADENVEKVEVSGDGVFVTIDGVEYMTNISVNYIGLDRYITELAQRSGRQISSADKIVEIEEYSNIPSDDYFREFDRLYLYLLEEEEFNLGNETCIVVEFM